MPKAPLLYRRHVGHCPSKSLDVRCLCPVWIYFSVLGNVFRRSLKTADWQIATERAELEFAIELKGDHAPVDEILVAKAILAVFERRTQEGPLVYLAAVGGSLKIGVTSDVGQRMVGLQTACASKLRLRRVFRGGIELERTLHETFAEFARVGEWFKVNPTLSAFIERSRGLSEQI